MSQSKLYNDKGDEQGSSAFYSFLEKNPKRTLIWMVLIMAISIIGVTAYSILKKPIERKPISVSAPITDVTQGLGQIINSGMSVADAMKIEKKIGHLLEKDSLSKADSLLLLDALKELESVQKKLNPKQ